MPSLYDEKLDPKKYSNHSEYVVELAYRKVLEVAERMAKDINQPDIIIGADTIVTLDGKIYGKPGDAKVAQQYLDQLSGRQHTVYTGVVIKTPDATVKFYESAKVFMTYLTDDVIRGYIRTREPLDKAGAYAIQGYGGSLIEKIDGDFYTVMGLPLYSLCKHLLWLYDDRGKRLESIKSPGTDTAAMAETVKFQSLASVDESSLFSAPSNESRSKNPTKYNDIEEIKIN